VTGKGYASSQEMHSQRTLVTLMPSYLATVERGLSGSPGATQPAAFPPSTDTGTVNQPTAFANGRYQVKKFLGEGGNKKVYLAQDTLLDK